MPDRPYTLLSCSVSLDGYLGDQTPRLALSNGPTSIAGARHPRTSRRSRAHDRTPGLGASLGVATAVAYGVMVLAASLPGAVVLLTGIVARREGALLHV